MTDNHDPMNVSPFQAEKSGGGFLTLVLGVSFSAILGAVLAYGLLVSEKEPTEDRIPLLEAKGPLKIVPDDPNLSPEPYRDNTLFSVLDPSNISKELSNLTPSSKPVQRPAKVAKKPADDNTKPPNPSKEITPNSDSAAGLTTQPQSLISEPPKASETKTSKPAGVGWYVQFAAFRNQAQLSAAWTQLQKDFPEILKGQKHISQKTTQQSGTFFRLLAGPHKNQEEANQLCATLKEKNRDCLVRQLQF